MLRAVMVASVLALPAFLVAADTLATVFGVVKDMTTKLPLTEITVTATEQKSGQQVPVVVRDNGRYEINIVQEGDYMVEYGAPGHVPKRVQLELRGPTAEQWKGGFGMNTDITLFREVEGLDLTMDGKPFGICRFDKAAGLFNWDMGYNEAQRDRIERMVKEYEKRVPPASAR